MRKIVSFLAASLLLSACTSSPNPSPTPTPGLSIATQRLEAQAGIVVANGIQAASILAALLNQLSGSIGAGQSSGSAPCKNGVETSVVQISAAKVKATVDIFYDPKCTTLFNHAVLNITLLSASKLTIAGTATTYDTGGKAVAFATLSNQTTLGTPTLSVTTGSVALSRGGSQVFSFGLSCSYSAKNSCGFGGIAAVPQLPQSLGVSATIQNFVASGSSNTGAVALNAYAGAPGSLKLSQGSNNSWTIGGGSLVAGVTGGFFEVVDAKALNVQGALTVKDAQRDATTSTGFTTRKGIWGGMVDQTSTRKQFATFSTDAVGTGAIKYSDGSNGNIAFFIITS
jgi:hypothetical protein